MTDDRERDLAPPQYLWVLEGPGLGDVAMEDVAKFLAGIVKAVELACGHAVGRQVKQTGRRQAIIEGARRIRLSTIASGSVQVYGSSAPTTAALQGVQTEIGLTTETVSELGLSIALDAARPKPPPNYRDVSIAWADLAEELDIGERFERIRIVDLRTKRRRQAIVDRAGARRLRTDDGSTLRSVATRSLRGYLFMANFDRGVAQLRTGSGEIVDVTFGSDQADAIQAALRHQPLVKGLVTYDPTTNRTIKVEARAIDIGTQLDLFAFDFWNDQTVGQLRRGEGVPGVVDAAALRVEFSDDDRAALLEALSAGDG